MSRNGKSAIANKSTVENMHTTDNIETSQLARPWLATVIFKHIQGQGWTDAPLLGKTSPGARVTAELGLCPDAEVPPRNLGKTIGGQRPIRRCPLLDSI